MKYILHIIIIIFLLSVSTNIYSSHVPGGNVTYECIGNNEFRVILTLYEDCGTAFETATNENIDITSDCGHNMTLSLTNTIYKQEISQLCPSSMSQSECNGGNLPGVYMHQWSGNITLPSQCDSWRFSFDDCCRNSSSNLQGGSSDYYFYADLNNQDAPCNSSPTITAPPVPYYCVNQPVCYNLGLVETNGDSLVYSLVEALDNGTTPVPYQAGFTGATPIPGITIDQSTGMVNFTPTTQGNYVVVIKVDEYQNGILVGTIIQDFTFEIANCSNQIISCDNSNISNVVGSVTQTNSTTLEMCEGVPFSFDLTFTDPDINDSIYVISNINTVLQGSVVTYSYPNAPNTSVMTMNVSWTPPQGSANENNAFTVTVRDNACPVSGQQTLVYNINVIGSTYVGQDVTICQGDEVDITATNGSVFNWYLINGEPINVGTNFSCSNCQTATISPSTTSTYEVVSDLSGNCVNRDTITINVAPNFTYNISQSSTSSCLGSEIQMNVTPDIADNYTYSWSPSDNLNNTNISNPIITPNTPGTYQYTVEVESPLGCIKYDTVEVDVVSEYAPDLSNSTINTSILGCSDSAVFNIDLGGGIPAVCGPSSTTSCSGGSLQTLGNSNGSNTSTTWPAPFGNYYKNAKHQFLYTASELQAMGFTGGKINRIGFEVSSMNNSTSNYNAYSVKMGCTGSNALTNWETGLTQVFGPQNITINTGWNDLVFSTAYEWDGTSNLVIEICYNNISSSYTQNASSPYQTTSFTSCLYYRSDAIAACPYTGSPTTSTRRPITRFYHCPTTPDPSAFSFVWNVNGTQQNINQYNSPTQFYDIPSSSTDYQLIVTNIAGGCSDTIDFQVGFECLRPITTLQTPSCNNYNDGSITVSAEGKDGPPWIIELLDNMGVVISTETNVLDSIVFNSISAGTYQIRVTDTVGVQSDTTVIITEPTPISLSVSSDTTICYGGTVNLYGSVYGGNGVNSYVYNWSGGITGTSSNETATPINDTVYTVYVTDSLNCSSDTLSINVTLHPQITTTTNIADTVCPGDVASLVVSATGGNGGVYNYNWTDSNGASIGNGDSITITPIDSASVYYINVTDNCETLMVVDSVKVIWYKLPQVDFDSDKYNGCYPVLINFDNLTPTNQVGSLSWDFGNGATSTNNSNPVQVYTIPGNYNVNLTVVSPDGCVNDTTINNFIEVYDYPKANFSVFPSPANIFKPTVEFTNESSDDAVAFEWFFRDSTLLGTSTLENPKYKFSTQKPGVYPVELVVTNANGCTDTIIIDVTVEGIYSFYAPTAFTPNGDGINDLFLPVGEGLDNTEYSIQIFNRDGQIIFSETDKNIPWDGTYLGKMSKQDVYIWRIKTKDLFTGEEYEYFGNVSLLK